MFPIQYENSNSVNNFKFEVTVRTGFDDWAPIDPINFSDAEVMGYKSIFFFFKFNIYLIYNFFYYKKDWEIPPIDMYPPIETNRKYRQGGEEEYFVRGKMG